MFLIEQNYEGSINIVLFGMVKNHLHNRKKSRDRNASKDRGVEMYMVPKQLQIKHKVHFEV